MFSERAIPVGGSRLNVASGPRHGPPLWLFHGLGRRWQDFGPLLADLSARWAVSATDHRGHGGSSRMAGRYQVVDYIADAASVVRGGHDPAVLVGHSLGALVALGIAARHPEAVRAVVLLDPPGPGFLARIDSTPYATMWAGMRKLAGGKDVSAVARDLAEMQVPGPQPGEMGRLGDTRDAAALRFMAYCLHDLDPEVFGPPLQRRWLDGFAPLAAAAAVRCPVLVLVGNPDLGGMLPAPEADALASALRDGARVDLPGVGHLLHWQDAPAVLRVVHAFLASV